MKYQKLSDIQKAILAKELTMVELVEQYLNQIEQTADLNIYIEVWGKEALEKAASLQSKIEATPDELGKLWGCVMSAKDVLCVKDHKVTAASRILEGFESQFTSTAVQRALDEDAIIIGRTNCDEFAMGSTNENSTYGPTFNAADKTRVPGGSSGGAAVSVQANTCLVALGSDTGGSVRQPASYCGIVGFKPTYGWISRYGLIAYGSSFDQIGILSHHVEDVESVLGVISGRDPYDATSTDLSSISHQVSSDESFRFAYFPAVQNHEQLNSTIKESINKKVKSLTEAGHACEAVEFDLLDYLVPTYYVLTTAEASSNLSRYDGIRYGRRANVERDINELYIQSRSEGFGIEVKRRIMMGSFVLSVGYFDAYFTRAQEVRRLIKDRIHTILKDYDAIILPTTIDTAPAVGASQDPVEIYLSDVFTVLANLCGSPAISIPLISDQTSLPIGIQAIGDQNDDKKLLKIASLLHSA